MIYHDFNCSIFIKCITLSKIQSCVFVALISYAVYCMSMDANYKQKIGKLIQRSRLERGLTQAQLAKALGTSQSAVNRIENGGQNLSLETLARISEVLDSEIVTL